MQISAPTHTHTQGNKEKEKEKEKRCSFLSLFAYRFRQWVHQRVLLDISIQPMWYPPASHYVYGVIYIQANAVGLRLFFPSILGHFKFACRWGVLAADIQGACPY